MVTAKAIAQTDTGKIKQLENSFGDIRENVGKVVSEGLLNMWKWIQKNQQQIKTVAKVFLGVWGTLKLITVSLKIMQGITMAIRGGILLMKGAMIVFNLIANMNPLGAIVLAVGVIGAGIYLLIKQN